MLRLDWYTPVFLCHAFDPAKVRMVQCRHGMPCSTAAVITVQTAHSLSPANAQRWIADSTGLRRSGWEKTEVSSS